MFSLIQISLRHCTPQQQAVALFLNECADESAHYLELCLHAWCHPSTQVAQNVIELLQGALTNAPGPLDSHQLAGFFCHHTDHPVMMARIENTASQNRLTGSCQLRQEHQGRFAAFAAYLVRTAHRDLDTLTVPFVLRAATAFRDHPEARIVQDVIKSTRWTLFRRIPMIVDELPVNYASGANAITDVLDDMADAALKQRRAEDQRATLVRYAAR